MNEGDGVPFSLYILGFSIVIIILFMLAGMMGATVGYW